MILTQSANSIIAKQPNHQAASSLWTPSKYITPTRFIILQKCSYAAAYYKSIFSTFQVFGGTKLTP